MSNKDIGTIIINELKTRMAVNLKIGVVEDIHLTVTRGELRELVGGTARIEHNTMHEILEEIREAGIYVVKGEEHSKHFEFMIDVRSHVTRFVGFNKLKRSNNAHKRLMGMTPARAVQK